MNVRSKLLFVLVMLCVTQMANATHYRAGEITYKQIAQNTYRISVFTYTDQTQAANQFTGSIKIDFGDYQTAVVMRSNIEILNNALQPNDPAYPGFPVQRNTYVIDHTYKGNTSFTISIIDQNRVGGIVNCPGIETDRFPFYVETVLTMNSGLGLNQSPILSVPPIDQGCVGRIFTHNPGAYDPDGDSLRYEIRSPQIQHNFSIPKFTIPVASNIFSIDDATGQLTWDAPSYVGINNIVIRIFEYRKGIMIGYVDRDMQIYITTCNNNPPKMAQLVLTCVDAKELLQQNITTSDIDAIQRLSVSYFGGPFLQPNSPASVLPSIPNGNSPLTFQFQWRPACSSIRYRPFEAIFKVADNGNPTPLVDMKYWNIKVVGPAPTNVKTKLDSNGIILTWNRDTCVRASAYKIYRKTDTSNWTPAKCETGVPASTGFVLIDSLPGLNSTRYFDNDFGKGLTPLVIYCYRVTATYNPANDQGGFVYNEVAESYASTEVCNIIQRTKPVITNVSVQKTSIAKGVIFLRWLKPISLDSTLYPAPYQYRIKRSSNGVSSFSNLSQVFTFNSFSSLSDTSLIDSNINTSSNQYYYKVEIYCTKNNAFKFVEESVYASSIKAIVNNTDKRINLSWSVDVPWINEAYTIYRKLPSSSIFDSLTTVSKTNYSDINLINGQEYCYYIKSIGHYKQILYPEILINNSQIICGIPLDTIPPCPPPMSLVSPCENTSISSVAINWQYPLSCGGDIKNFKIYYSENKHTPLVLIADNLDKNSTTYTDTSERVKLSIAGCYVLTAIDTNGNESSLLNKLCIDNCPYYTLPNVFSPDGDNINSVFKPFPYRFVDKIDMVIYNRWGQEVFITSNPEINWNGKDQTSGKELSDGVYFYICDVYERYLNGSRKHSIHGSVTIIR